MDKTKENKNIAPLFIFFMIVTGFCTVAKTWLTAKNIDPIVLGFGNIILFILFPCCFFYTKESYAKP